MASTDARPVPRKNIAYRVTFPLLDADGDLVTGAASLDSEVSIDGGAFADCTSEATEIATSSGVYFLDLTAGEMNGDTIAVIVKTATAGAKTTTIVMYPEEVGDYRADVVQISGDATAADNAEAFFDGTGYAGTNNVIPTVTTVNGLAANVITAASIAADAITAAKVADGTIDAATFAAGAINAAAIAADAITDAKVAADVTIASVTGSVGSVVGLTASNLDATVSSRLAPTVAARTLDVSVAGNAGIDWGNIDNPTTAQILSGTTIDNVTIVSNLANGSVSALAIATDAIDADAIAASAVAEIQSGLSTLTTAQVNAEVVDALATDTYAEPGQAAPAATASLASKINYLYKFLRNKITQTSTTLSVFDDAGTVVDQKATVSDDGTTYTRGEIGTGP